MTATARASVDRGPCFDPYDVELNLDRYPMFARPRDEMPLYYNAEAFVDDVTTAPARWEGCIALAEILKRFPGWDVDLADARLSPTSTVRGGESMPAVIK